MGGSPGNAVQLPTVTHVAVTATGGVAISATDQLYFTQCTPPDWSMDLPSQFFHGNSGAVQQVFGTVTKPTYGTASLSGGWDPQNLLAGWMNKISDQTQDMSAKVADITIQFMDSKGTALFQWHTSQGIMTSYSHSGSDASSNAFLMVNISIAGPDWQLQNSSGSPLGS